MSIDVEYALKKDIRNNPVVREVDTRQERELGRTIWLAGFAVAMVLFTAWQHYEMVEYGYELERARVQRVEEEIVNRQLRLNVATHLAPQQVEQRARRELGMVAPTSADTVIIERAIASTPSGAVIARAE